MAELTRLPLRVRGKDPKPALDLARRAAKTQGWSEPFLQPGGLIEFRLPGRRPAAHEEVVSALEAEDSERFNVLFVPD